MPYHADVVAIEQNLGQLHITLGWVTRNDLISILNVSRRDWNAHLRHVLENHVCEKVSAETSRWRERLTDVVIEADQLASEFCTSST